jgi:hypothetical protein
MEDVEDDRYGAFEPEVDYQFEDEMNETVEWLDEGHFISQDFLKNLEDGSTLSPPPERPLRVHTYLRTEHDLAFQHTCHPFISFVYLLENADQGSDVFLSSPYLTDKHAIDQLVHYAKPVQENGSGLNIYILLGPEEYNQQIIKSFVGDNMQRFWAVHKLKIRTFGHIETKIRRGKMVHSKGFVTSCGAMVGSYNYTWGSRLHHREDSIVLGPGSIASDIAKDIQEVWDASTDFTVENPSKRKATSPAGPPPPGYKPPKKAPEASGDSSKGTNNSTSTK